MAELRACSPDSGRAFPSLNTNGFLIRHQQLSQENAAKEILAAFKQSDTKKQGFITAQELRQILTSTGEKVCSHHLRILTTGTLYRQCLQIEWFSI